jgi:hypothetical protein
MTMKILAALTSFVTLASNMCIAESNNPPILMNWGKSVQGVQLSISITNNVIKPGEETRIKTIITNSGTNAIDLSMTGSDTDFDLFLTNGAGRGYNLTPEFIVGSTFYYTVNKTNKFAEEIPLTVGTNVEPGDYTLYAYRRFSSGDGHFRLESNPIKLQVK